MAADKLFPGQTEVATRDATAGVQEVFDGLVPANTGVATSVCHIGLASRCQSRNTTQLEDPKAPVWIPLRILRAIEVSTGAGRDLLAT
jgi:hypothetical protein